MSLVIRNVNLIDVEGFDLREGVDIYIENDRINQIGNKLSVTSLDEIDGTGKYVIPGLIDTHMHFFQSSSIFTRPDVIDLREIKSYFQEIQEIKDSIEITLRRYLACGVTGIVDCGGPFWNFEVRDELREPTKSPHISVAGPLISTVSREILDLGDPPIIKANSPEEAIELAQKCSEYNPVFIKSWFIYLPESFDTDSEIIKAGIEETKRLGLRSAVHATELETAKRAVQFGADILVHSVMNEEVDDEFIALLKENNVIYIPTLIVSSRYIESFSTNLSTNQFEERMGDPNYFHSIQMLKQIDTTIKEKAFQPIQERLNQDPIEMKSIAKINLKKLMDAGVNVATGTDAGNIGTLHGPSMQREMEEMVDAGLSPIQVLHCSTIQAAKVINNPELGSITENKIADLVILNKNPMEDISNCSEIDLVIRSGKPIIGFDKITPINPVDIVQRQLDMYNARDIEGFLQTYDADVQIFDLQTNELRMEGLDTLRERYSQLFKESPNLKANLQSRIVQGSLVIDHEFVTGFRGDNQVTAVAIYEVKNQYITRVWFGR